MSEDPMVTNAENYGVDFCEYCNRDYYGDVEHECIEAVRRERDKWKKRTLTTYDLAMQLTEQRDEARRYARLYRKLANNEHKLVSVLSRQVLALEEWKDEALERIEELEKSNEKMHSAYNSLEKINVSNGIKTKKLEKKIDMLKYERARIASMAREAIMTAGMHHKIWYLERIIEACGVPVDEWREQHQWDEGVAP